MTRHTRHGTTDNRQQTAHHHNTTLHTTRRDATASMIHVCAGWQVRHLHAAMQDHRNTAVLSVGLGKNGRPGTGHREWSVVSGQWSVVGSGHWWCLSHRQVCYCFVDGQHPRNIAFAKFEQMPPTEPRHRHLPPCAPTCLSVIGQLRSCRTPTGPPRPIGCQRIREFTLSGANVVALRLQTSCHHHLCSLPLLVRSLLCV